MALEVVIQRLQLLERKDLPQGDRDALHVFLGDVAAVRKIKSRSQFWRAAGALLPRRRHSRPRYIDCLDEEFDMPKGVQRNDKMSKKPKKDSSPPKESSSVSTRPVPPTTAVLPKGKLKNKQ